MHTHNYKYPQPILHMMLVHSPMSILKLFGSPYKGPLQLNNSSLGSTSNVHQKEGILDRNILVAPKCVDFFAPRRHLTMFTDFWLSKLLGRECFLAKEAAKYPAMHKIGPPQQRIYLAPNVYSVKAENT